MTRSHFVSCSSLLYQRAMLSHVARIVAFRSLAIKELKALALEAEQKYQQKYPDVADHIRTAINVMITFPGYAHDIVSRNTLPSEEGLFSPQVRCSRACHADPT